MYTKIPWTFYGVMETVYIYFFLKSPVCGMDNYLSPTTAVDLKELHTPTTASNKWNGYQAILWASRW
jgi:hypothetical protein